MTRRNQMAPAQEEDSRVKMLNAFLSCPHRDTREIDKIHAELQENDPLFYAHLAAWYQRNGEIRDHKEVFTARLIVDSYTENREVGLALWQRLPFWLKNRVLGYVTGKDVKVREKSGEKVTVQRRGRSVSYTKGTTRTQHVGLDKNIPTSFRRELAKYLEWLEKHPEHFDAVAAKNRADLKQLYFTLRQRQYTDRANKILFNKEYPDDSKLKRLEEVAKAENPVEQAKAIVKERIPFTTAIGMIENPTPAAWVALIEVMSPQEAINHVATFEEHGLMDNAATKELIMEKLRKAEKSKKVSGLKGKEAKKSGRIKNEEVSKQLDKIADTQVKKTGQIKMKTCICVDKSGSMQVCIEAGKRIAALVSGATVEEPIVLAFDRAAFPILARGNALSDWENAFRPIRAHGRTKHSAVLDYLTRKNNYSIEQFVFVTDERETERPYFAVEYEKYAEKAENRPHVVVVHVDSEDMARSWGRSNKFSESLQTAGIEHDVYEPENADYYSLPGLLQMLARKSKLDLVYEVMDTPLPQRRAYA